MRRETQKTNKTVVAELKLEAPFSAKQKGVLHIALSQHHKDNIKYHKSNR